MVITDERPSAAFAAPAGQVRVVDGDTLDMSGVRVRIWGIDAPERDQSCEDAAGLAYSCGQRAGQALAELVAGQGLECEERDIDRYGRTVARCSADGEDLGRQMVRAGHALDYTQYSKGVYLPDELRARRAKVGVWQGKFMRPEAWRRTG